MSQQDVTLTINGVDKLRFANVDEMTNFIHSEMKFWGWLKALPMELVPAGYKLYEVVIESCWRKIFEEQVDQVSEKYEYQTYNAVPVLLSSSPEAMLIEKIKERFGSIAGFMAVIFINTPNRHTMIEHKIIKDVVEIPGFEYDRIAAIQTILAFQNSDVLIVNSHLESLKVKYAEFDKNRKEVMSEIAVGADFFSQRVDGLNKVTERTAEKVELKMDRRIKRWLELAKKVSVEARSTMEAAKSSLNSAEAAYKAQIDLSDSVRHWEERKTYHERHKVGWLVGVIISMLLTFSSVVLYFKYGGMIQMSGVNAAVDATNITSAVTQVSGVLLLLTLMGILVRITLRQFNSHSHLALESQERVIFTKTYLTLMRDGKLNSDLDKKLVLESLFRPTQSVTGAEINFSPPMELIYKAISDSRR